METSFLINEDGIVIWTDEYNFKKKLLEMAEENPDVFRIKRMPDKNDGNLGLVISDKRWLKYRVKKPLELTDERMEILRKQAERLRKIKTVKQDTEG